MSTRYSVIVVIIVALLLVINALWVNLSENPPCADCKTEGLSEPISG